MKYVILIGDGMADEPLEALGGRTVLEYAETPNMDAVASSGRLGLFRSVPGGFPPGSDVANMSILGYSPARYYTGRAPLEAASIGVRLGPSDTALRCNLVSLGEGPGGTVMKDYSAGHITTDEADSLIKSLDRALGAGAAGPFRFHRGKSYRHLVVWLDGPVDFETTPPHDITGRPVEGHLPGGEGADELRSLMERSREVLRDHPVNRERRARGLATADSIWLWGQGRAPRFPTMKELFGVDGSIISAVDLMNGLGVYAGLEVIDVPGATGYIDTDYSAKARYALESLEERDFVCVHVEAPDEAGHNGSLDDKLRAVEDFDGLVVGAVREGLRRFGAFRLLVITDHPTPVRLRTHTSDPVPFALCGDGSPAGSAARRFCERDAAATGVVETDCEDFARRFFGG
ncbi:MAG TPA: cofactor-independent phosphoglycerate mutase [Deltaproteobacteria bacterium]|nr:cofactor-independent phosphoglycerate mutase [Deltaproteobacteria bacterium]